MCVFLFVCMPVNASHSQFILLTAADRVHYDAAGVEMRVNKNKKREA